jgi:hydrogenase maturation factor
MLAESVRLGICGRVSTLSVTSVSSVSHCHRARAGGLLCGISAKQMPQVVASLQEAGYTKACVVGEVVQPDPECKSTIEIKTV